MCVCVVVPGCIGINDLYISLFLIFHQNEMISSVSSRLVRPTCLLSVSVSLNALFSTLIISSL